ncbi:MAG: ATP-binding cassette domain-containing protein, partial [Alkalispirochaetaceae bacterium]
MNGREPVLSLKNLKKHFPIKTGVFSRVTGQVKAVDGITFDIYPGETFGLVGESGCGKSTTGQVILRLFSATDGSVIYKG